MLGRVGCCINIGESTPHPPLNPDINNIPGTSRAGNPRYYSSYYSESGPLLCCYTSIRKQQTVVLYKIMLVVFLVFLFLNFHVKCLVLRALSISPYPNFLVFSSSSKFCLCTHVQMEFFLCCHRLTIFRQTSNILVTTITN